VYSIPAWSKWLVYDRSAILNGEVWRTCSGNWVHFSATHLIYNLIALGAVSWIAVERGYRGFASVCLVSAVVIGLGLFWLERDLHLYGGLSGIATAAMTFVAAQGLRDQGPWRWVCIVALAGLVGKVVMESASEELLFVSVGTTPFKPVPLSHGVGIIAAVVFTAVRRIRNLLQEPQNGNSNIWSNRRATAGSR
jgi:rhomboid family GlyGly-CTERM serine protease